MHGTYVCWFHINNNCILFIILSLSSWRQHYKFQNVFVKKRIRWWINSQFAESYHPKLLFFSLDKQILYQLSTKRDFLTLVKESLSSPNTLCTTPDSYATLVMVSGVWNRFYQNLVNQFNKKPGKTQPL